MSKNTQCSNCNTTFEGNFCPNCGQKVIDLERPLNQLIGEVATETLDIDGRAFRTLKMLFLQPGVLTSEFLAGRRKKYTPPLRLYLVISLSFFIVAAWLAAQGILLDPELTPNIDAASQAQFLSDDLPRLMFVLLPVFALTLKMAYRQRLYFDHLIHAIHLHSAAYVVLAAMLPLEQVASTHWVPLVLQVVLLGYFLWYFTVSLHRVYQPSWPVTIIKSFVILMVYLVIVSVAIESSSSFLIMSD